MYDMKALKINIVTEFDDTGEPFGYYQKDVHAIVTEGDPYELQFLRRWIDLQFYHKSGWDGNIDQLSLDVIDRVLKMFETLGIKPTDCVYDPEAPNEVDE